MFRKYVTILITLLAAAVFVFAQESSDTKQSEKPCCGKHTGRVKIENLQTVCPVMGGEIDKEVYTDHGGKRIFFCCEACLETFKKDPETYLKKMEESGVTLYKTPCSENQDCTGCKKHKKATKT